jgi:hypothetical protein
MPAQTPQDFVKSLQTDGILLVRNDDLYFVPQAVYLKQPYPLPDVFGGASFKGPGILFVRIGKAYFIAQSALDNVDNHFKFPNEFSKDFEGVSALYFKPDNGAADSALDALKTKGKIKREFRNILTQFADLDGISQAVYLDRAEDLAGKSKDELSKFLLLEGVSKAICLVKAAPVGDKTVTRAENSNHNMFVFGGEPKRILVSMVKGGRPSDR